MNTKQKPIFALFAAIAVAITMHACAGMGSMTGENVKIYNESIDRMIDITRRAIKNKGYAVREINQKREPDQRTRITFVNRSTAGQQMVNSMQSYVLLAKVDTADAVAIRINNPDYSYGTPTDQRIDYAKILFEEIEKLLE